MFYVSLVVFILAFIFTSYIFGLLMTQSTEEKNKGFSTNVVFGMMLLFAVFQLIAVPSIQLQISFRLFFLIISGVYFFILILSIILHGKKVTKSARNVFKGKWNIRENWYTILVFIILIPVVLRIARGYLNLSIASGADDAFFVGTAMTTIATNTMYRVDPFTGMNYADGFFTWRYVLSPWPIFWAYLSELFNVHPAIMSRVFLPFVLLLFVLCVYHMIGKVLFLDKIGAASFWIVSVFLIIYSGVRVIDEGFWFLLVMHHGRVLVWLGYIPLCFYFMLRMIQKGYTISDWICITILSLSSTLLSSMSIALIPLCIGMLSVVALIYHKNVMNAFVTTLCTFPNLLFGVIFIINTRF